MDEPADTHRHRHVLAGRMPSGIQLTCFNTCTVVMAAAAASATHTAIGAVSRLPLLPPYFSILQPAFYVCLPSLCSSSLLSWRILLASVSRLWSPICPSPPPTYHPSNYLNTHPLLLPSLPPSSLSLYRLFSCCRELALLIVTSYICWKYMNERVQCVHMCVRLITTISTGGWERCKAWEMSWTVLLLNFRHVIWNKSRNHIENLLVLFYVCWLCKSFSALPKKLWKSRWEGVMGEGSQRGDEIVKEWASV